MNNITHEPTPPAATPRPCSTPVLSEVEGPHSSPIDWLRHDAESEGTDSPPPTDPPTDPPAPVVPAAILASPFARHDGWTGEKMAIFCEALAETAVVAEACDQARMGISGAYACRRRNPVFAAAWDAALTIARERLADTLLARSMEGNIEQIWRDGEVVGERHVLDNRLGLAILRRLDRLAEMGIAVSTIGQRVTLKHDPRSTPGCNLRPVDWNVAIDALRTGDEAAVAKALALFEGDEMKEVEGPPNPGSQGDDEAQEIDVSHRFRETWRDGEKMWMTDFPPAAGFTGYQSCEWGEPDETYERQCTPEETAVLEADAADARAAERAEDEALRDQWLDLLKGEHPAAETAEKPAAKSRGRTR